MSAERFGLEAEEEEVKDALDADADAVLDDDVGNENNMFVAVLLPASAGVLLVLLRPEDAGSDDADAEVVGK